MRFLFFIVALTACLVFSAPVWASLPYYNADIGYTIWLPKSWAEASTSYLKWAEEACIPVPVQGDAAWKAGYHSPHDGQGRSLLVEVKPGRKMHAAAISNFNSFLVKSLHHMARENAGEPQCQTLKAAKYFEEKKTLRLETEVVREGSPMRCLTYVVYTRKGMLTFVGYVDPTDDQARQTIDKAVLSLYLDDHIRY